jgi:hypothetical protein
MKKVVYLLILSFMAKAQSVIIDPNQIQKTERNASASEDLLLTSLENRTPTIVGRRANTTGLLSQLTPINAFDVLFTIGAKGFNGAGFIPNFSSSLEFIATDLWSPTSVGSQIRFRTTPNGSTTLQERMLIDYNGHIGIGTLLPRVKLHVSDGQSGTGPSSGSSTNMFIDSDSHNYLMMSSPDAFASGIIFKKPGSEAQIYYGANNSSLDFFVGGSNRLNINSSTGNIGVGTINISNTKLEVAGDLALNKQVDNAAGGTMSSVNRNGASIIKFTAGGDLHGISNGTNGTILYLYNTSTTNLVIHDDSAISSTASHRILTNGIVGGTLTISSRGGATLVYDGDAARWRVVSVAQ